ncbi:fumarylacetoacetate hydrolase family protein [Amycolatopsis anabasis]|uniref:fumarylacetoacetate hydrolase family protein n=1 Tax=Amycolatopsis anabasis TaxID=1840409 RepID=UPI00131CD4D0|nr:fumarylacetoacetate hydrolase family protein [Amycolatopsis anabasis]
MIDPVSAQLGLRPGKVIAVHSAECGSYFLKASSTLAADSGVVTRPDGPEPLTFEGEIALVIGERGRRVAPAWSLVGWVTAANDLSLCDPRYADRGSNLRATGGDGFTPIGPNFLPAGELDPAALRVRAWVNGELVQSDTTGCLPFSFAELVADLSRLSTLEPGDVILTGTPAGASVVEPGDVVEVEVDSIDPARPRRTGRLRTRIVGGPPLDGPPPGDDPAPRTPESTVDYLADRLTGVAVAKLSAQLRKQGLNHVSIDGVRPARPGAKFAGRARTLRCVPLREDLFAERGGGFTARERAIESMEPGEVLVLEARGEHGSGALDDILALRAQARGAAAIVTDGGLRDSAVVAGLGIPVFHGGAHPAVLGRRHVPWDTDVAIGCGGTTVRPGDLVVGDDDGVVVIPPKLAEQVLAAAIEQERQEAFIAEQVRAGHGIEGLYPLSGAWLESYLDWVRRA